MSEDASTLVPDMLVSPATQEISGHKPGTFQAGVYDPRRNMKGNTRGKRIREIERMLNKEHRNLDKMTEVFARLRALALGEVILIPHVTADGTELTVQAKLIADPAFMKLYLDRLLGPAKANDDEMDLSDASSEVIEYLRIKVSR